MVPELRIRVKLYKNELGEGQTYMWTYFLRVGEDNPGLTFHAEHAWGKKEDALRAAKTQVNEVMKTVEDGAPGTLWDVKSWHGED